MVRVEVVVRELGHSKPEYSLKFVLPHLPRVGDYISIYRPDRKLHTEDLIVRHVWWLLDHPETGGFEQDDRKIGTVRDIFVECDQALGPYANDQWRKTLTARKECGLDVPEFDVARFSVPEADLAQDA